VEDDAGWQETRFAQLRHRMVQTQLVSRGIQDTRVLEAMSRVPRHLFLDPVQREAAYEDSPIPIGLGQTLSQPYIVAFMTEQLNLTGREKVLEIGTGSGYQTAVLAELVGKVFTLEVLEPLSQGARRLLGRMGYHNIEFAVGDGRQGWPEEAPFDGILAAAVAKDVPAPLRDQLADGGRMILPLGEDHQELWQFHRFGKDLVSRRLLPVRFVPLVHGGPTPS
jgi:protein-L-isoaspartate(D-aspartate) O-methyltransferase